MRIFSRKNFTEKSIYKMITETGNGFYSWNGKLYQSDVIRTAIKPRTKALGKMVAKHIRDTIQADGTKKTDINPILHIKLMLEEPNEYMTMQMMIEKVSNQLALNNNAFILILRDSFDKVIGLYPIICNGVEAKYNENEELLLKFWLLNGKNMTVPYSEIIHIRDDYNDNDIFGTSPIEALSQAMEIVTTIDQGIVKAIKNGAIIRWLLKFTTSLRPEDLKTNAQEFASNYLDMTNGSMGVAAVDSKADAIQIKPNDFVPNAVQADRSTKRIYEFFGVNEKIINSSYSEDEWISYYESVIEPISVQMSNEFTRKIFTRKERSFGNKIIFESSNLTYASMETKLKLVQFVDRGIMTPNEVRSYLNLAPIDGGDKALLRKDTGTLYERGDDK